MPRTPKVTPVSALDVYLVVDNLSQSIDRLVQATLGYAPSRRNYLTRKITQMSRLMRQSPTKEIREEYDSLLDTYEKEFGWLPPD